MEKENNFPIRVKEVGKSFGHNEVLKGVSFCVQPREIVGIVGASGCGKSTLLKCINFIVEYDKGEIYVDNELVGYSSIDGKRRIRASETTLATLRRKVGMVFQSYNLFPHLKVLENLTKAPLLARLTDKTTTESRAREFLSRIGLAEKENAYPLKLSGGQQQRVAIMRALMMEPTVMLFDEITSALDPSLVGGVLELLADLAEKGLTMLIVSHELGFLERVASRVLFLQDGLIWEQGEPAQLLHEPNTNELQDFLAGFYH